MSEIKELCRKTYRQYIETQPIPTELRRALRTHERVPTFIDNLARELSAPGLKVNRDTVIAAINDMTRFFISCVERSAEDRALSPIARAMKTHEAMRKKEMSALADALNEGGKTHVTQTEKGQTETQTLVI